MTVLYSAAVLQDAEGLAAILRGWIIETNWMPKLHIPVEDLGFLQHLIAAQVVIKASLDGRTAGFLARDGAEISCLYLAPFARSQGIGSQLLTRAKADTSRLELWTFQANPGARRFYARHGFAEAIMTDGQGNDEKLPDVRMIWEGPAA